MSFSNPTPLRLGMTGKFNDRQFRVAGRIVMGMEENGETYHWNEFNLVSDDGDSATLVFEETERGGEWRLFTLFEVEYPLTAADAATKRVGDRLTLDDKEVRITLVDESRVYHIEGEAPEGVEVGDIAHYFNAETSERMIVVSWTGEEVEYYRGVTLSAKTIADAFQLPVAQLASSARSFNPNLGSAWSASSDGQYLSMGKFVRVVAIALSVFVAIAFFVARPGSLRRAASSRTVAPAARLKPGAAGTLEGRTWQLAAHALIEIAQVHRIYERHEYYLRDDRGGRRLLVQGWKPGDRDWCLLEEVQPATPLTPLQAAAIKAGETVNVDGRVGSAGEIAQSVLRRAEGDLAAELRTGTTWFGFTVPAGPTTMLVRWNQDGIHFFQGKTLPAATVEQAFSSSPKN